MHILITGANGFIGRNLARRLLDNANPPDTLSLLDLQLEDLPESPAIRRLEGSFADPAVLADAFSQPVDLVFHLAALPSGSSEANPELSFQINVLGTQALLNHLKAQGKRPRFVFTSSIAVYGKPDAAGVNDDTAPKPDLSYGAHKVMAEALVNDYVRREWIQGCAVRIPGIVARPPEPNGAVSIFFSDLIRELCAGRPYTCPVSARASSWLMSVGCCVDNLLHAATMDTSEHRSWCLPATHVTMDALVNAIAEYTGNPDVPELVNWQADPWVESNFGSYPPIECPKAEARGFRKDVSLAALVAASLP